MLIGTHLLGEYFEMPLSGTKVKKALMKIIAKEKNIRFAEALKIIESGRQSDFEERYYKEIKKELAVYIKEERTKWERYERAVAKGKDIKWEWK